MSKSKALIINVSYVLTDSKVKLTKKKSKQIAAEIEARLTNTELGKYLWTLGDYEDTIVTDMAQVIIKHDD